MHEIYNFFYMFPMSSAVAGEELYSYVQRIKKLTA